MYDIIYTRRIYDEKGQVMMPVKLQHIIDEMETQSEGYLSFIHLKTGEIVTVSQEALSIAEDGEDYDDLLEWQQEDIETAYSIIENEQEFVSLPTKFDIDEYGMMERFSFNVTDSKRQEQLLDSIRGKGAFRRFQDQVNCLGIEELWYEHRNNRYKEIAIDFCKYHNINYTE